MQREIELEGGREATVYADPHLVAKLESVACDTLLHRGGNRSVGTIVKTANHVRFLCEGKGVLECGPKHARV